MRLLIDTQALLWFQASDSKISEHSKKLILNPGNNCYVSIVSFWEIAIKINLQKLSLGMPFKEFPNYLTEHSFSILDIGFQHLNALLLLPLYHKDPFDRLLIAQAIAEDMTLVSADKHFGAYPVKLSW